MQFQDLEYYVQLTKLTNFSKVAEYFGVTQPTITYAIKRLEDNLGTKLVINDPGHHTINITAAGKQFAIRANSILAEMGVAEQEIKSAQEPTISLGLPPIIGTYFFPKLVPALKQQGLLRNLNAVTRGSSSLLADLTSGNINIAFLGSSEPLSSQDLEIKLLAEYSFKIISSAKQGTINTDQIAFSEAANHEFVGFNEGFVHNRVFKMLEQRTGKSPATIFKTTEVEILKNIVQTGAGIALLTSLAIGDDDNLLATTLTDKFLPTFKVYLAYRKGYRLPPKEQQFTDIISGKKID
ncbi:LysR family transcriptional regulator [Lentilactobacillus sp. Marseille-Q4993]|uniref:LysR family transcriptional regulator n=1 Tax=Lentilactobacillus sp. Marseille-Q4993 TaxID=3039492 RepID=UPI0024BCD89E|nr:LysR family transcriptional regulator [Lentilactobacillus sp. Marseille-Q4993]